MPYGLKNAGATYQYLVDHMFPQELGRNMEVYIDDMLVKNRQMNQHLVDLAETFDTLRKYHMKLNPAKCIFWSNKWQVPRIHGYREGDRS
ncbi:UNVERIFIED_CONTAM: hypothetical protein Slati_3737200 [Sesamum latifolium]|uniref:Reverse transcriptase domain-containing protein n=1 Tax=Sesamum latifolium TaxID=2727402 RepID=A0AAW2U2E4_9LAMI